MKKLIQFAGPICIIAIVLLIRCPSLRPDLSPLVRGAGAVFGLYPKPEEAEVSKHKSPFHLEPATGEEAVKDLLEK